MCDRANLNPVDDPPVCTAAYARTEGGSGASTVADVNLAFANAGRVSTFYATFGTPDMQDLTALIGHEAADGKKLRSTVRVCITGGSPCPYDNAYWNGQAMFYGKDYPRADDIVGHEMTHGVIERIAGLIYFDQSGGAINESLADIIGEIIDHQTLAAGGESPSEFLLGEDLPDQPPFRSAADPTAYYQPDRMTSTRCTRARGGLGRRPHQLGCRQQGVLPDLPGRHVQRPDDHRDRCGRPGGAREVGETVDAGHRDHPPPSPSTTTWRPCWNSPARTSRAPC